MGLLQKVSWEYVTEYLMQIRLRESLKDEQQLARFEAVRGEYASVCSLLLKDAKGSEGITEHFDWSSWSAQVRKAFEAGVPLGFLAHPVIHRTMVFSRRRGIKATRQRLEIVKKSFGQQVAAKLLKEDYIGLPTITDAEFMTSANRCHHASHLAHYALEQGSSIWECDSLIEWGGGYGDMAHIVRRMNPKITYIIIDLPELLALQYVYLSALEGKEQVHVVSPTEPIHIVPGKINLVAYPHAMNEGHTLKVDGFLSTWALTESPIEGQKYVEAQRFFGAKRVLMASMPGVNNYIASSSAAKERFKAIPVPTGGTVGAGNVYWFV